MGDLIKRIAIPLIILYIQEKKRKKREYDIMYRKKNKERIQKRHREYEERNRERRAEYKKKYAKENREKIRGYNKKSKEKRKEKAKVTTKKWWDKNSHKKKIYAEKAHKKFPEKRKARLLIMSAIKSRKIIKPKVCSACNRETKIEAHHINYEKALNVVWLCRQCHINVHKGVLK